MTRKRAAIRAILYGAFFAAMGYLVAHYYPFLSSEPTQRVCQPFSPCRSDGAPGYMLGGFLLGALLGAASGREPKRRGKAQR